jgi:hypothetical protein
MLETYHSSLNMLAKVVCNRNVTKLARHYRDYCTTVQKHHGRKFMVQRMKDLLTICERYTIHQPIEPLGFVKSDKDGFPTEFKDFKPYLRSKNLSLRIIVLAIFRSVEVFRLAPSHDISTVTTPPKRDEKVLKEVVAFIPGWIKSLNKTLTFPEMSYHYTVKKGPNGPALSSSDSDLTAISNDAKLFEAIQTVSAKLNDEHPIDEEFVRSTGPAIHSKLTQFPEKAGKTRTIAVVDYYSQRALSPLHSALMNLLNSLETDGTSSHMNVGNYIKERTKHKDFVQTFDLTAFTDRFPREIQKTLLLELCEDKELAQAWWTILADRTFTVAWSGEQVTYAAGQPMGAKASWPLCALAHHAVVEYCRSKRKYRLIGDDVGITDQRSAKLYQEVISALGVETNPGKGTLSYEGSLYSSAEIAKRLYLNGVDLTPLTPGLILSLRNRYLCLEGIRELKQRFDCPALPHQIVNFHYPKGEDREFIWCLLCNPLTGVIMPSDEGYNNFPGWGEFDDEDLRITLQEIRCQTITQQIEEQYNKFGAALISGEPDYSIDFSGDLWQNPTTPPDAVKFAHQKLLGEYLTTWERVATIDVYDDTQLLELEAVEYLPNPENPFLDLKEVRKTRMSSLIRNLYLVMSEC